MKVLWLTDLHLDKVFPWTLARFIRQINKEKPDALFITGDISNGMLTCLHLALLAKTIDCKIYFILGNHCIHGSSISVRHQQIKKVCEKYQNIIWLANADVIKLNDEVGLIGADGWYSADNGNPDYLKFTFDWFMIRDFRILPDMESRIKAWKHLADRSAKDITKKLNKAIDEGYKTIYILTHIPPWKNATRDVGTIMEKFWLPYNCNLPMGRAIEDVMDNHKKKNVIVWAGHTHSPMEIRISKNIECRVGGAQYFGLSKFDKHTLFI